MNIFFAPPSQIQNGFAELTGQEAIHASRVLRVREGESLNVVDGRGGWYEGTIRQISRKSVQLSINAQRQLSAPDPEVILAMGIIKKRDRLEFAVEKAVELGVSRICLFRSEHSVKENVRMDRLESTALSAMKQSLRAWLPPVTLYDTFELLLDDFATASCLIAHEKVDGAGAFWDSFYPKSSRYLLSVGPEGGFAPREIQAATQRGADLVSLGPYRLRAETAAVAFLSRFTAMSKSS